MTYSQHLHYKRTARTTEGSSLIVTTDLHYLSLTTKNVITKLTNQSTRAGLQLRLSKR